jgi:hypothetical protein
MRNDIKVNSYSRGRELRSGGRIIKKFTDISENLHRS